MATVIISAGAFKLLEAIRDGWVDNDRDLVRDRDHERYNELNNAGLVTLDIRGKITETEHHFEIEVEEKE